MRRPGQGFSGREMRKDISEGNISVFKYEMRLLDALSWLAEIWKISIVVKDETTVDALCGYVKMQSVDIVSMTLHAVLFGNLLTIISRVRPLRVVRSTTMGIPEPLQA